MSDLSSKTGKVLSIRLSILDISSCREVCQLGGLHSQNITSTVSGAISLLLGNLRKEGVLTTPSIEKVMEDITILSGGKDIGRDFTLPSFPRSRLFEKEGRLEEEKTQSPRRGAVHPIPEEQFQEQYLGRWPAGEYPFTEDKVEEELQEAERKTPENENIHPLDLPEVELNPFASLREVDEAHKDFLEDIRLTQTLESEELLSSLLVTDRREDDKDVKLIDPLTVRFGVEEEKEKEEKDDSEG